MPQQKSGLTPLEMATKTKSDHRDLARTHVWGCPCYVLEAKLQNNKKLPKWNWRARMGQFLGFSRHHSSTVALVRNLHTGHVSPQYHIVFDDKFETVFSNGKTDEEFDKLCEQLFVNQREYYVEEKYDENGILIYEPPPLNEVWFSETERRDGKLALEKQRRCTLGHRDLARTHVWGCSCYVLEAKLQNNKKLPKWNRRARTEARK